VLEDAVGVECLEVLEAGMEKMSSSRGADGALIVEKFPLHC
jgi:hypothetical protein